MSRCVARHCDLIVHNAVLMPLSDRSMPFIGPNITLRIGTNRSLRHEPELGMRFDVRGSMGGEGRTRPMISNMETR
jgi:hypothetical protein